MESDISATYAARNFSDLLNRVRYKGETFTIKRGGEAICRLVPLHPPKRFTLGDFARLLHRLPKPDSGFWDDVEKGIQELNKPSIPESRWND